MGVVEVMFVSEHGLGIANGVASGLAGMIVR